MNECADNFSFLYDKTLKEMTEEDLKTQWMNIHVALSDGNSHDINSVHLFSKQMGFTGKHPCKYWYTLCNINQAAWNFLCPEPEVIWHPVVLSHFTFPVFVYLWRFSGFHSSQSIMPHIYYLKTPIHLLNMKLKHELKFINFLRHVKGW
jgi:hypothetical protein